MPPLADRVYLLVLAVSDIGETLRFYERALGFERDLFRGPEGQPRFALKFGEQKINLQERNTVTPTKAKVPTLAARDFCVIAAMPLDEMLRNVREIGRALEAGRVRCSPYL